MTELESTVAGHYGDANLLSRILTGLEKAGVDLKRASSDDLAPFDEFHIGGRAATEYALSKMPLGHSDHVLDIGCGIGGAARTIASNIGCQVTGIDLTPEFIAAAKALTDLTRLSDRVSFKEANALATPFADETFDAAITVHAAMNIADRAGLYAEISRVLKPDATFCIYDIMKISDDPITFPVPWAQTSETSHLTTPGEMRTLLKHAGFDVSDEEARTDFAIKFFRQRDKTASPIAPRMLTGSGSADKFKNVRVNIEQGRITPVLMIARKSI